MLRTIVRPLVLVSLAVALATPWVRAQEKDLRTITASKTEDTSAKDFGGCSFACATSWKLRVSSSLPPQSGSRYDATQLEDLRNDTAWASRGKGEFIEVTFEGHPDTKAWQAPLRGFRLVNGYAKSPSLFEKNSRVKTLRVDHNGKPLFLARLLDTSAVQAVSFPDLRIHAGDRLRLTIVDIYPGSKYPDTCISDIIFDGGH